MSLKLSVSKYFQCPVCKENDLRYSHLTATDPREVFNVFCDECASKISFSLVNDDVVLVSTDTPPKDKAFILNLLKLDVKLAEGENDVYLLYRLPNYRYDTPLSQIKQDTAYIIEANCPAGILGVGVVLEGDNDDPHGILEYVDSIYAPEGWDPVDFHNAGSKYGDLFPNIKFIK